MRVNRCAVAGTPSLSSCAAASACSASKISPRLSNAAVSPACRIVRADRVYSYRGSVTSRPIAAVMPGCRGEITFFAQIASPKATPCSGPAPPNAIRLNPRGSIPRATEFDAMASAMWLLMIRKMPSAASLTLRPSGSATLARMAASDSAGSIFSPPPRNCSGSSRPSTTCASVTVGSVPPLP